MKLRVNPKVFADFDNPRIAVVVVRNATNRTDISAFEPELAKLTAGIQEKNGDSVISQLPKIAAWREAYRTFGVKAKDYPSSIESLYKRAVKGVDVGGISPLVDIYNYISLKYMLPAGGEDTDKMDGDLELTYATANETPVIVLGKDEAQAPAEGEVIYKDARGTICRKWNWREVARTVLTEDTKNCILVLEALDPVTDEELSNAQQELSWLVEQYCTANTESFLLNSEHPLISLY